MSNCLPDDGFAFFYCNLLFFDLNDEYSIDFLGDEIVGQEIYIIKTCLY